MDTAAEGVLNNGNCAKSSEEDKCARSVEGRSGARTFVYFCKPRSVLYRCFSLSFSRFCSSVDEDQDVPVGAAAVVTVGEFGADVAGSGDRVQDGWLCGV